MYIYDCLFFFIFFFWAAKIDFYIYIYIYMTLFIQSLLLFYFSFCTHHESSKQFWNVEKVEMRKRKN